MSTRSRLGDLSLCSMRRRCHLNSSRHSSNTSERSACPVLSLSSCQAGTSSLHCSATSVKIQCLVNLSLCNNALCQSETDMCNIHSAVRPTMKTIHAVLFCIRNCIIHANITSYFFHPIPPFNCVKSKDRFFSPECQHSTVKNAESDVTVSLPAYRWKSVQNFTTAFPDTTRGPTPSV